MKLSVFCGVSVDGFLARPDDALDFLDAGGQEPHGFTEFLASIDVVVLGRRTLQVVMKLGDLSLYGKKALVVLSSLKGADPDWAARAHARVGLPGANSISSSAH